MRYEGYISDVVNNLSHSEIDIIFEMASKMEDVVILAMGQPDLYTPESASEEGIRAIREHCTRYTDDLGLMSLRKEAAQFMKRRYGVGYNPEREIIIFAGVSNGMDTAIRAITNPGDEIIVQQPSYSSYVPGVLMAGGVPVILDTFEEEGFKINPERLKSLITPRTKALIISYPNNPTGAIMTREDLLKISQVVKDSNILVISDEIYSEIVYDEEFVSFASLPYMKERTIILNGASKTYSMAGWRVGFGCSPGEIVDAMLKVHQYSVMNVPSISQYAAAEAFRSGDRYIEYARSIYSERRSFVYKRLKEMGLRCFEPKGTFYAFPSIKELGLDSSTFCKRLLVEGKVAAVPGTEFGKSGEGYIRISYTTSMENLRKGMDRMERFVKSL